MKHKHLTLLSVTLAATMLLTGCQIAAASMQIAQAVKTMPMQITLQDGTLLTGEAHMPDGPSRRITLKDSTGEKHKIDADDITYLTVWNQKAPDDKHILLYRQEKWMALEAAGEHLMVAAQGGDYYVNRNGTLTISGKTISYYAFRPGEEEGTCVATRGYINSTRLARNKLVEFLADDPELSQAIADKEVDPFDFETICAQYHPQPKP